MLLGIRLKLLIQIIGNFEYMRHALTPLVGYAVLPTT